MLHAKLELQLARQIAELLSRLFGVVIVILKSLGVELQQGDALVDRVGKVWLQLDLLNNDWRNGFDRVYKQMRLYKLLTFDLNLLSLLLLFIECPLVSLKSIG